jgi:hypothetical protein
MNLNMQSRLHEREMKGTALDDRVVQRLLNATALQSFGFLRRDQRDREVLRLRDEGVSYWLRDGRSASRAR